MPNTYTLALIILGLYGYGTYNTKPSSRQSGHECTQQTNVITENHQDIVIRILEENGQPLANHEKKHKADREKQKEKIRQCSDLKAQWAMADVTWYAFMAGMLGIGLVFITLVYTAKASVSDAKARRAWVWLDTIEARHTINQHDAVLSIDFNPLIRNSGETPTPNASATCNLAVKPTIDEAIKEIQESVRLKDSHPMFVAPKTASPLTGSTLTRRQLQRVKSGHSVAVFWMQIKYNDLFEPNVQRVFEAYRQLKIKDDNSATGIKSWHVAIIGRPDIST